MDTLIGTGPRPSAMTGWRGKILVDPARDCRGGGVIAVRKDDRELVATIASRDVRQAERGLHDGREMNEASIAELVAERVVDELEVVEVEHQDAEGLA